MIDAIVVFLIQLRFFSSYQPPERANMMSSSSHNPLKWGGRCLGFHQHLPNSRNKLASRVVGVVREISFQKSLALVVAMPSLHSSMSG